MEQFIRDGMDDDDAAEDDDDDDDDAVSGEEDGGVDKEDDVAREMAALREEEKQALEGIAQVDDEEIEQGQAVKEQKQLWDSLLEVGKMHGCCC